MKLCFFTDPHLGVVRGTHTTSRSQEALRKHLYEACQEIVERAREENATLICTGDLFDRHSNKEPIVLQGIEIAAACEYMLAGNHDMVNRKGEIGSLQLVKEALDRLDPDTGNVIIAPGADPYFQWYELTDKVALHFIPHAYTQELFESSIHECIANLVKLHRPKDAYDILCLHCNVGEAHGKVEDDGTTLALTPELQKLVVKHFDRVLVGHEHERREIGGSILVLGNIYPLSFGEISDRWITWFDTETREWGSERIFEAASSCATVEADVLIESEGEHTVNAQLVKIVGTLRVDEYPKLQRAISRFWSANEASLFAVNNSVEIERPLRPKSTRSGGTRTLRSVVTEAVSATAFKDEYEQISAEEDTE